MTALNQQQPTLTLGGKIYEGLLKYGADLKPMPGMAQSWEISPDGLTYTFKLFPGITFHDGKPMTSDDVVFSCMKLLVETHPRARQNFSRVASAEAPDPLTVVFKLKQPFAPFIGCFDCTSAPIVPKHIYDGTDYRKNPENDKAIGTGPFKLKEWVRGSHVHLVRHDGYYRKDEPYLDEIVYRVIPDAASRALALENGTVQLVQWSDVEFYDVQRFKAQKSLEFTTKGYEYFAPHQWLEMNNRIAPMNDKRFRQAVMHLIDREAFSKRVYFRQCQGRDRADLVEDAVLRSEREALRVLGRQGQGAARRHGIEARRQRQAGRDQVHRAACGKILSARRRILPPELRSRRHRSRAGRHRHGRLGREGRQLGLRDDSEPALPARRPRARRRPHLCLVEHQEGHPVLEHTGLFESEVDKLFDEAAVTLDEAKRQELYTKVQQILVEDVPVAWTLEIEYPIIYDKAFKNIVTTGIGSHETFGSVYKS